jgi:hypothetical protein
MADVINLEASNVPGHFVRHSAFLGELTEPDRTIQDFAFQLVSRGDGLVAIRSRNFPMRFLRHRDLRIHLESSAFTGDEQFRLDSTFALRRGLADRDGVSFRSLNFPDRYLRHRDSHLWVEAPAGPDDELFRRDATFVRRPAMVLIDR